ALCGGSVSNWYSLLKLNKLTNVRMIAHIARYLLHEISHQTLSHGVFLALKPCRFPIGPLLIVVPRWVNLPQGGADNAAIGLVHQFHPQIAWVRVHGFDKVCFYFCALFGCVGAEE